MQVNLNKVKGQNAFLERHLRGTTRILSVPQAINNYGIMKLSARICELRQNGLQVTTLRNSTGNCAYRISSRDVNGSRARLYNS